MKRSPRSSKDGIFANGMGIDVAWQGVMVTVLTLAAYVLGLIMTPEGSALLHQNGMTFWQFLKDAGATDIIHQNGMTMAFLTLSMAEIFHSFNMRSRRASIFQMGSINKFLVGAMVLSLILSTAVIYIPFLAKAFDFAPISAAEYATAMVLAIAVIPIVEIVKLIQRKVEK